MRLDLDATRATYTYLESRSVFHADDAWRMVNLISRGPVNCTLALNQFGPPALRYLETLEEQLKLFPNRQRWRNLNSGGFKEKSPGGKRSEGPKFFGKMKWEFSKKGLSLVMRGKNYSDWIKS